MDKRKLSNSSARAPPPTQFNAAHSPRPSPHWVMAGEPINLFVRTNIDNFVAILKASSGYFAQHDYPFYPRAKSPANYDSAATIYSIRISDIQTNREKYRKQWDEQRNQLMQGVDKANDTYDKMTSGQKKRFDANKQQDSTKQ